MDTAPKTTLSDALHAYLDAKYESVGKVNKHHSDYSFKLANDNHHINIRIGSHGDWTSKDLANVLYNELGLEATVSGHGLSVTQQNDASDDRMVEKIQRQTKELTVRNAKESIKKHIAGLTEDLEKYIKNGGDSSLLVDTQMQIDP